MKEMGMTADRYVLDPYAPCNMHQHPRVVIVVYLGSKHRVRMAVMREWTIVKGSTRKRPSANVNTNQKRRGCVVYASHADYDSMSRLVQD